MNAPFRTRLSEERGAILVMAAVMIPVLLALVAGGMVTFSLSAAKHELQRSADQAALAGAASIPPADPMVLRSAVPFPLPGTQAIYNLAPGFGPNLPRMGDPVADPRAVSCAYGSSGLTGDSASILGAFGEGSGPQSDRNGNPVSTMCADERIRPALTTDPNGTTPAECANALAAEAADRRPVLQPLVNQLVRLPLDNVLPAVFTPVMRVDAFSGIRPPLLALITGQNRGTAQVSATALRRIKNAVVVPILPAQQLQIELGLNTSINVMTDPVNLNNALRTAQRPLIDAIDRVDQRLSSLMPGLGAGCTSLLYNLRRDLRDIYDPPVGPAPSALDIVDAAVSAQQAAAGRVGTYEPDPTNPNSLAGEAFFLIGVSSGPLSATQIPILDAALVVINEQSEGNYRASAVAAANARGAFRATLVD
ncbi:MAG: TadE/TadG family type IV pilus assembly protein [Actinomycetota bacterium]